MGFTLTATDLARMQELHPNMIKLIKRAAELTIIPFKVVEGVRSQQQCMINYGKGRNAAECVVKGIPGSYAQPNLGKVTWLNHPLQSKHTKQADGFGHAVDLLPAPYDWKDVKLFDQLDKVMVAAAKELNIHIRWGADWNQNGIAHEKGETDSPHFELA